MDYCYTCRRTLNGALVCPGCGAYAPDIEPAPHAAAGAVPHIPGLPRVNDPVSQGRHAAQAPHAARAPHVPEIWHTPEGGPFPETWPAPGTWPDFAETVPRPAADEPVEPSLAARLHGGRAARRRQLERWRKNRRRAGVATAVALFGGGVTVASMQNHGSGRGTTASPTYDTVTPVTLRTGNDTAAAPASTDHAQAPGSGRHAAVPAVRHQPVGAGTPTHPVTDSAGSVPLTTTHSRQQPAPSTSTAPHTGTVSDSAPTAPAPTATASAPSTANPPATTAPSTSPSTPPDQQGLCILVLCLK
jgi:hypothetical protein